jgi:hypothetical protein
MTDKLFVVSVGDVYGYDSSDNLLFRGITLIDSNITVKLTGTDVRGGKNAPLQYVYYHSPDMMFTVSDSQFNLDFLAGTTGQSINVGNNIYVEESVVLSSGAGVVVGTPLSDVSDGVTLYGWVTFPDNSVQTVTFTGKNFTVGSSNQTVCVRYYAANAASRSVTIPSNFIPKEVKLVIDAQLASSDEATNIVGKLQIIVPRATMTGNFTINLKMDSVATTPVELRALAFRDPLGSGGCSNSDYYAKLIEVIDNATWYSNLIGLSILGGDFSLGTTLGTRQLSVRAIPANGAAFTPPAADLTWTSGTPGKATVSLHGGLVTGVANGSSLISVTVTSATQFDASVTVSVP